MTTYVESKSPHEKITVLAAGDMEHTAILKGDAVQCLTLNNVRYQIRYTDAASPIGVIGVEVCESGLEADFKTWPLLASQVSIIEGDGALNAAGTIDISGVGTGYILINLADVFGFLRPFYTSASAGAADTINIIEGAR